MVTALERHEAPRVTLDRLALVHPEGYIDAVLAAAPKSGHVHR